VLDTPERARNGTVWVMGKITQNNSDLRPGITSQLLEAVALAQRLDAELDRARAVAGSVTGERDCYAAAYLDLLARYRALLSGSLPVVERRAIHEASALAIALAIGEQRMAVAA